MKILQIIYTLSSGGAERFVVDLSNELSEHECNDVSLMTILDDINEGNNFYLHELSKRVKYINLKLSKSFKLMNLIQIYSEIKRIKPDIVHLHLTNSLFSSILSILFFRSNTIYVQTLHSKAENYSERKIAFFIIKILYFLKLVRLVAISDDNDNSYKRVFNLQSDAIIYNGRAKPNVTNNLEVTKTEIDSFKKDSSTKVFLHIARFAPPKNQVLLIDSFNEIISQNFNALLLIIGTGFDTPKGLILQEKANANIHFLGTRTNIADYLYLSDAFCLSSLFEGMPITIIEAFACGTIPISTPVSGVVDLIKNGENGFISKDFSVDSYVDALKEFIDNYEAINRDDLIQLYEERLSIKNCALNYIDLYNRLINK